MPPPRRVAAESFPADVFAARTSTATLVIPALDEAASVGRTVAAGRRMQEAGVLDDVVVVDGGSQDDTVGEAAAAGAKVVHAADVYPETGPVLGKGDTMWRALGTIDSDVVAFLDADLDGDIDSMVRGLLGPLLTDGDEAAEAAETEDDGGNWAAAVANGGRRTEFVKGSFHRVAPDGASEADPFDGGRVTEMVARPLLNLWRPDLAGFYQPLSGQVAGRTALLRSLPVLTGYAVEIAMLIDVVDRVGLRSIVEVDLGTLRNRPRSSAALAPMAQEVLYGFARRVLPSGARPRWRPYTRPVREFGDDAVAEPEGAPANIVERPPIDPFGSWVPGRTP